VQVAEYLGRNGRNPKLSDCGALKLVQVAEHLGRNGRCGSYLDSYLRSTAWDLRAFR
jgi:hypothetical protein